MQVTDVRAVIAIGLRGQFGRRTCLRARLLRLCAPFIRHWDINRLAYDGDADRWFDPAWLVAG
jgi:hypothetical protein